MNNIDLDGVSPKNVDAHIGKHKLLQESIREEEIAQKKHKIQMIIRSWWFLFPIAFMIILLICGGLRMYFWKKDPVWITVINIMINIILQSGLPALFTFLITNHFKSKNENPK